MRTQYLSAVVFIHFSEGTAASAVVDGTHVNDPSSNLTSIPRPSETTSMAENDLEPYDSFVDKADEDSSINTPVHAVEKSEERMPLTLLERLKSVVGCQQMKDLTPEQAFEELHIGRTTGKWPVSRSEFTKWLRFVDKHQSKRTSYDDEDVVKLVIQRAYGHQPSEVETSGRETLMEKVVQLITKYLSGNEDRANRMLYLLFRSDPSDTTAIPIMDVWLKKKVKPDVVYRILHLDEAVFVETLPEYPILWLRYIVKYNELEKDRPYPMEAAVEQLQQNMGLQFQTVALLNEIRQYPELERAVEILETLLQNEKSEMRRSKTTRRRRRSNDGWRSWSTSSTPARYYSGT